MKFANAIVVGGPIAVGKSTLVGALPFEPVQELDPNDELQKLLLEQMYEGDPIAPQVFQLDMLLTRFDKYKKLANRTGLTVFDRSIFEDKFFAMNLLKNYPNIWDYYNSIWEDKVKELVEEVGIPKLYIFLSCDWEAFKERVFARNREAETANFQKNEAYFKNMIETYPTFMKQTFEKYNLPYIIIDTNKLSKLEVIETAKIALQEKGIY